MRPSNAFLLEPDSKRLGHRDLVERRQLVTREPAELGDVVGRMLISPYDPRPPHEVQDDPSSAAFAVRHHERAEPLGRLDPQAGFLDELAAQGIDRVLVLVEEAAGEVPHARVRLPGSAGEQYPPGLVGAERAGSGRRIRPRDVAARRTRNPILRRHDGRGAPGAVPPLVQESHARQYLAPMPIREHEFGRIGLLAELPGERLRKLSERMRREQVPAGAPVVREGDEGERFYVVLSGVLAVSQQSLGPRRVLRPGDYFGEVALAMDVPRTASVRALTPAVVASCDRETFDEFVRPLFSD
jgi:hypothetical protein